MMRFSSKFLAVIAAVAVVAMAAQLAVAQSEKGKRGQGGREGRGNALGLAVMGRILTGVVASCSEGNG